MTSEEVKTTEVETEVTVFKFGDSELSDVIFVVDGKEFHCHKMVLAAKSEYFKAMFFSAFKEKDQKSITIDAESIAFKRLLEIVYKGFIDNPKETMVCDYYETLGITYQEYDKQLWEMGNNLFALADRFLLTDIVRSSFETMLIRYDRECPYGKASCHHCAMKLLISLCHNIDEYKNINVSSKGSVMTALSYISGDIQMSVEAMKYLLGRN